MIIPESQELMMSPGVFRQVVATLSKSQNPLPAWHRPDFLVPKASNITDADRFNYHGMLRAMNMALILRTYYLQNSFQSIETRTPTIRIWRFLVQELQLRSRRTSPWI